MPIKYRIQIPLNQPGPNREAQYFCDHCGNPMKDEVLCNVCNALTCWDCGTEILNDVFFEEELLEPECTCHDCQHVLNTSGILPILDIINTVRNALYRYYQHLCGHRPPQVDAPDE